MSGLKMRLYICRGPVWCSRIRPQINAACSMALCCRLVLLIPSHDRCAKLLLALFRSDVPRPLAYAAMAGARYSSPFTINAQTIRAILLASATRTSIGGLRVSIPASHVPGRAV